MEIIAILIGFLLFVLMMYLLSTTNTKPGLVFMDLFSIPVMQLVSFFLAGFFIDLAAFFKQ